MGGRRAYRGPALDRAGNPTDNRAEATKALVGPGEVIGQSDQRLSLTVPVPANSTVNLYKGNFGDQSVRTFLCQHTGGACILTVTEQFERATMPRTFQVPVSNRATFQVRGSVTIDVSNADPAVAASILWAFMEWGDIGPVQPNQVNLPGLVATPVTLAPGAWITFPLTIADDRTTVQLSTIGGIDFQWISAVSAVQQAFFTCNGVSDEIVLPPFSLLQARHPGGATDTRAVAGVFRRG